MVSARAGRAAPAALAVSVAGLAILVLVVLIQRWRLPGYAMPASVLAIAGLCAGLTVAGGSMAVRRRQAVLPWLTALTTLLFLAAYITAFSVGALVLLVAVFSLVARVRLGTRRPPRPRARVATGLLLSLGLAPLGLLAIEPPVVECMTDGVANGSPVWTWFGSGGDGLSASGNSSSSSLQHGSSGTVTVGATTYRYTCADGRLVQFSRN